MASDEEPDVSMEEEVKMTLDEGELWEDPEFPASAVALFDDPDSLPDFARDTPCTSWKRPEEYSRESSLFKDGVGAGDVVQGGLGDCWLLGSMASVAAHPTLDLIRNLFVSEEEDVSEAGLITCRFFKEGEWIEVMVDTRIPLSRGVPAYAHCHDNSETWVVFLEKAYAKLHGTYEALNGGSVAEALVDLTGGASEKIVLTEDYVKEMIKDGRLWDKLKRYMGWGYLLGCSMSVHGGGFEEDSGSGILINHAYSILFFKEIGGLKFIKVRNPWGRGEWLGDWSDRSRNWEEHPDVEQEMKDDPDAQFDRDSRDGTFWMLWEDFVKNFNKVYVCRLFGEEFNAYTVKGAWAGKSAAGAHRAIVDRDDVEGGKGDDDGGKRGEGGKDASGDFVVMDSDPFWFDNPQYRLSVSKPTDLFISLMQRDRLLHREDSNNSINFVVLRQRRRNKGRLWEQDPSEVVADAASASFSSRFPQREVTKGSIKLLPRYNYIVVPHTLNRGVESGFTLRMFAKNELRVDALPETYTLTFEGSWEHTVVRDTAGGPLRSQTKYGLRDNSSWCQNPQYCLTLPEGEDGPVTVSVVVERTDSAGVKAGRREGSTNYTGVIICRAPQEKEENPRRRRPVAERQDPLGLARASRAAAAAAAASSSKLDDGGKMEDAMASKLGEDGGDDDDLPPRKLQVESSEWCQSSDYSSRDIASTLLTGLTAEFVGRGLLLVPTLMQKGLEGSYRLRVSSDRPVMVRELPEGRQQTIAGEWAEASSVGCHLQAEWKRNPKFHLALHSMEPAKVRITLSRSEERWRRQVTKDAVGCMIGFYIFPGTKISRDAGGIYHEGKPWNESTFVPMHSVSTPTNFYLDPLPEGEVYTIVAATFGPKKRGPFYLTVTSDQEFSLRKA
eukprot:PLAT16095.1.p1 GENE.PLAT16095.1~~PLAT16095.1.p1  ORF type:complete len:894 (-),score=525.29 PLAT16095.1:252-2933(-)